MSVSVKSGASCFHPPLPVKRIYIVLSDFCLSHQKEIGKLRIDVFAHVHVFHVKSNTLKFIVFTAHTTKIHKLKMHMAHKKVRATIVFLGLFFWTIIFFFLKNTRWIVKYF
jgi:hypothetical protein